MQKKNLTLPFLIGAVLFSGCTIDISQPAAESATSTVVMPTLPATSTPAQNASSNSAFPVEHVPVTWSNLILTGKLIFTDASMQDNNPQLEIQQLDLSNGDLTTIFQAPQLAWIYSVAVSPDGKQIVMSYSPPATVQSLFVLPVDGSQPPQPLFQLPSKDDQYIQPTWSPDGRYLYFVHTNYALPPQEPNQHYPIFEIYRMAYPGGQLEKLVDKAYWPRLSADGSRMVYVSENPQDGTNNLFLSNADGSNASQVVLTGSGAPNIIDAPIFSPDGQSILFSAPVPVQSYKPSWLDRLLGVIIASAHSVPSEWWSVPLGGGATTQLTHVQAPGLYASISPDNQHIASFSGYGIFVMNPDGTGLTTVLNDIGSILGTVNWIP